MKKLILSILAVIGIQFFAQSQSVVADSAIIKPIDKIKVGARFNINGNQGGKIEITEIALWDSISVTIPISPGEKNSKFHVVDYQLVMQTVNGARAIACKGSKITDDVVDYAKRTPTGHIIIFYNITISDGTIVKKINDGPVFRVL